MSSKLNERLDATKQLFSLLKEVFFVAIFGLLIFSPITIRGILNDAGIKSFAGIEFRDDLEKITRETQDAIGEITTLRDSLEFLQDKLETAIAASDDSRARDELQEIKKTVSSSTKKATQVDNNLKRSLSQQYQTYEQIDPQAVADVGWMYLGKIGSSGDWAEPLKTIEETEWPLEISDVLKIRTDVYLREDVSGNRSSGKPLAVAKVGEAVEVVEIDSSLAKGGGWFIWAKVRLY